MSLKHLASSCVLAGILVGAAGASVPDVSYGARLGPQMGYTDWTDKVSYNAGLFGRYGLSERMEAEARLGYGRLSADQFDTDLMSAGVGLVYSLAPNAGLQPIVQIGLDALHHDVANPPAVIFTNAEPDGWTASVPVSLGVRKVLGAAKALEITVGGAYTMRDDLDGRTVPTGNDWVFNAAVSLVFGEFAEAPARTQPAMPQAPKPVDSDGDGLYDADERGTYRTNPRMADSDMDDLSDGDEVRTHGTDPNKADTDGDGMNDGAEVKAGRNPLVADAPEPMPKPEVMPEPEAMPTPKPMPAPEPRDMTLDVQAVFFPSNYAMLDSRAQSGLDKVASFLRANPLVEVTVRGYADSLGAEQPNLRLSQHRAEAVRRYLVDRGVDAWRITIRAFGEADPVGDNSTPEGRKQNRRVELEARVY